MERPTQSPGLEPLNALIGDWTIEATHPAYPATVVRGQAAVEWLEGEKFLIHRSRTDHPDFPMAREAPGFSQRFTGTFGDDGDTISGRWELSRDDSTWDHDLEIEYRRAAK